MDPKRETDREKLFEILLHPSYEMNHPLTPSDGRVWILQAPPRRKASEKNLLLVFTTKQRAVIFLRKNTAYRNFHGYEPRRIRLQWLVMIYKNILSHAAVDWKGYGKGFWQNGGRYALR